MLREPRWTVYGFDPMVGAVEGFRRALLGTDTQPEVMASVSVFVALFLLISGAFYVRRMEKPLPILSNYERRI